MYFYFKKNFYIEIKNYLESKKILTNKIYKKIKSNKLIFFIFIRTIPAVPYQLTDLMPIPFNLSIKSYFITKFLGSLISNFIIISTLDSLFKKFNLKFNTNLINIDLTLSISILLLVFFILLGWFYKKKLFNY